ncbi:RNA polymerase Rpb4-domain-containing protein [Flagelloscypha sp. PMI_526]|nr:RNA polymerase Rpb4-domain-containing protein [Flagelloscypha sp. PMI_526]
MQIINSRAALLSNYEVLELLKEQEADHLARQRTALRVKKEEEQNEAGPSSRNVLPGGRDPTALPEISENMRTLQVEAIAYLSADHQPTALQTPEGITELTKQLQPFELTKAEKLQIVNLAPRSTVELYVIVEESEDRFGEDGMNSILALVNASLSEATTTTTTVTSTSPSGEGSEPIQLIDDDQGGLVYPVDEHEDIEPEFDDSGDGAGVEGDLEMDED